MANASELKVIAKARIRSAEILMNAEDWLGAAYMLAYALECALKAVTCKTLNLIAYPDKTQNKAISSYFKTHAFDELLIVSGMEDIFSTRGPQKAWQNWSDFANGYPSNWPEIRYITNINWDKHKVENLYSYLVEPEHGIITIITKKRKW